MPPYGQARDAQQAEETAISHHSCMCLSIQSLRRRPAEDDGGPVDDVQHLASGARQRERDWAGGRGGAAEALLCAPAERSHEVRVPSGTSILRAPCSWHHRDVGGRR